jgi:drug/metabolite transporter (DMT)-like permease
VRRPTPVELMLLTTILLWSLNLSVTKYLLTHGLEPLSYAVVRYGLAGLVFVGAALAIEGTLRIERRHLPLVCLAAVALWLNQLSFVFALDLTTASTIGLLLGAIPIFTALLGLFLGLEHLTRRFWVAAAISALGVALVALGAGSEVSASGIGILLGLATGVTGATYSVTAAPLMRHYSPMRMSAAVFPIAWVLIVLTRVPSAEEQDWSLGVDVWALLLFATFGPLVVTTVLWFRAIHRIGAARATLAANLQPFVAALLAVILLSEPLSAIQVLGGLLIASGILFARRRSPTPQAT